MKLSLLAKGQVALLDKPTTLLVAQGNLALGLKTQLQAREDKAERPMVQY